MPFMLLGQLMPVEPVTQDSVAWQVVFWLTVAPAPLTKVLWRGPGTRSSCSARVVEAEVRPVRRCSRTGGGSGGSPGSRCRRRRWCRSFRSPCTSGCSDRSRRRAPWCRPSAAAKRKRLPGRPASRRSKRELRKRRRSRSSRIRSGGSRSPRPSCRTGSGPGRTAEGRCHRSRSGCSPRDRRVRDAAADLTDRAAVGARAEEADREGQRAGFVLIAVPHEKVVFAAVGVPMIAAPVPQVGRPEQGRGFRSEPPG